MPVKKCEKPSCRLVLATLDTNSGIQL